VASRRCVAVEESPRGPPSPTPRRRRGRGGGGRRARRTSPGRAGGQQNGMTYRGKTRRTPSRISMTPNKKVVVHFPSTLFSSKFRACPFPARSWFVSRPGCRNLPQILHPGCCRARLSRFARSVWLTEADSVRVVGAGSADGPRRVLDQVSAWLLGSCRRPCPCSARLLAIAVLRVSCVATGWSDVTYVPCVT